MTRVCLIGDPDYTLQYELLSRETSREALATYDLTRPFENSLAVRTVSVGAAISLLNDLQWYLTRFVDEALVLEPSVSDEEWLSRALATDLRNGDVTPAETAEFCKIYGLEVVGEPAGPGSDGETDSGPESAAAESEPRSTEADDEEATSARRQGATRRLVEPLYVRRTGGKLPEYDLRDVDETLVVRVTEDEYA
ncbi:DUF5804 family protein [Natrarchaeobaculum aegyptiacum]|uniref:Uncharacterized protein n=1 Tax=Natrarchaeobaculum aegyptiacum TaxID=745377 RepID=A0A2Z2HVX5_9EURY|nr:DUF5804 family protein [Natrarchaeobaculum aegyptiacum]ARS91459.1 hypothetical protein B1756_18185 [Natrarchaeobaculum aegyptiacum]